VRLVETGFCKNRFSVLDKYFANASAKIYKIQLAEIENHPSGYGFSSFILDEKRKTSKDKYAEYIPEVSSGQPKNLLSVSKIKKLITAAMTK